MNPRISLPIAAVLALAGAACVPRAAPPPPVAPVPAPAPAPAPPAPAPVADWQDWPWTPGAWRYVRDPGGSRATYAPAGQPFAATLTCDRAARTVTVSRPGTAATPFTIRTSATTRTIPAQTLPGTPPQIGVRLPASDRLLDAMAFTRGRFVVEQAGATPLVLPPWAEVGRVIEDCRG